MFLSAAWTLILTAPIHCGTSRLSYVMLNFSKTVPMKKQTQLHLGIYLDSLRMSKFSNNFLFGVNYSFKSNHKPYWRIKDALIFSTTAQMHNMNLKYAAEILDLSYFYFQGDLKSNLVKNGNDLLMLRVSLHVALWCTSGVLIWSDWMTL